MKEEETIKQAKKEETKQVTEINYNHLLTPPFAYFLKNYWKERNSIFNELYEILYNEKNKIIMDIPEDKNDDLSDLKFYEEYPKHFIFFENPELRTSMKYDIKNEMTGQIEINEENNNSESDSQSSKTSMIYNNCLNNYVKTNYKFKNEDFSLSTENKKVFFKIKNIKIFEIAYLKIITINKSIKEWVCNSYYGLYLLHKIKRCKKPYPVFLDKNEEKEIKSISNEDDFDKIIDRGIVEFEDLNIEINLDSLIDHFQKHFDFDLLKCAD